MTPPLRLVPHVSLTGPTWYLPTTTSTVAREIVRHAKEFGPGLIEVPPGSNRGPELDEMCRKAGVPYGSYWCALWVAEIWRRAGMTPPPRYPSCDAWMAWGKQTHRWSQHVPSPGCAVLYGTATDAKHIGIVIRTDGVQGLGVGLSLEGNTSVEGSAFERNGTAVSLKIVDPKRDPVLGYVHPLPLVSPAAEPPKAAA